MPNYLDRNTSDIQAIHGLGQNMNQIALQIPALRMRQQQLQQQLMVQKAMEILHRAQAAEIEKHGQLYDAQASHAQAQTKTEGTKQQGMQTQQDVAQQAGQSTMLGNMVGNPDLDNQAELSQAIGMGRQAGVFPQEGFDIHRSGLVDTLRAIGARALMQSAASAPGPAAQTLIPRNIPQGGTGINAMGTVGYGQPKPMILGPNQTGYPAPGADPQFGIGTANRGENLFDLSRGLPLEGTQMPPFAQGQPYPDKVPNSRSAATAVEAGRVIRSDNYRKMLPSQQAQLWNQFTNDQSQATSPMQLPSANSPQQPDSNPIFNSEEEARGAGYGTGSQVILKGVGKIRLH